MADIPVLDWRCTQCGEAMTWQLVTPPPGAEPPPLGALPRAAPTIEWWCARCGPATTWMLVKTN